MPIASLPSLRVCVTVVCSNGQTAKSVKKERWNAFWPCIVVHVLMDGAVNWMEMAVRSHMFSADRHTHTHTPHERCGSAGSFPGESCPVLPWPIVMSERARPRSKLNAEGAASSSRHNLTTAGREGKSMDMDMGKGRGNHAPLVGFRHACTSLAAVWLSLFAACGDSSRGLVSLPPTTLVKQPAIVAVSGWRRSTRGRIDHYIDTR
ncbi:hypothetical protein B0T19DRAFT_15548 [Cercophora scortea]|uniref:Uncharacterized protein n=1 Tax=Cercophora scortea TaxID=314031 RepID=A0AAE0MK89_9PEZI|nr:hypothetical protein B0T19DRAFT_15548 [Cercophora scortea]